MIISVRSFFERSLIVWLTLLSLVGFYWPSFGSSWDPFVLSEPYLRYMFAATMFCVGSLLPRDEVLNVIARWPRVLGGVATQYIAMPIIAFLIAEAIAPSDELYAGIILVGCVPGAMASNVLTLLARGNVSYSVSLTTVATLLSPLIVPATLLFLLSTRYDVAPFDILVNLLMTVVGPVIFGFLLSRSWPSFGKNMQNIGPPIAHLTILWIVATVIALNRERVSSLTGSLLVALLMINLLGYASGYVGSRIMRLESGMTRALTLEVGMQNAGLGATLASTLFPDRPEIALPPAIYTFGCMITGTMLARIWVAIAPHESSQSMNGAPPNHSTAS